MITHCNSWNELYAAAEQDDLPAVEVMAVELIYSFLGSEARRERWGWVVELTSPNAAKAAPPPLKRAAKPAPSSARKPDRSGAGDTMPFGKHKGKLLADLDDDYLTWLHNEAELREPLATKVREEVDRRNF